MVAAERASSIEEFLPWADDEPPSPAANGALVAVESRVPAHDLAIEEAIVGGLLRGDERLITVARGLPPEALYSGALTRIYRVCLDLVHEGLEPTLTLVGDRLRIAGRLAEVGQMAELTRLVGAAPVPAPREAREWVAIVLRHWRARRMTELGHRLTSEGYAGSDPDTVTAEASAELTAIAASGAPAGNPLAARLASVDAAWLAEPPPAREYLARDTRTGRGALVAHGVALLVAAGGSGKSYATISLALAVASGTPWCGCLQPERPARVLLASAEDPGDEVRRRLYHTARSARIETIAPGAIEVLDLHDAVCPLLDRDLRPTEHARALVELVRAQGPFGLVVVDPLARLAGAPIDADNSAAGALVSVLEEVATAAGGLVLAVHHTSLHARRSATIDATAIRGPTALGDSSRLVMLLTVDEVDHGDADVDARLGELVTMRLVKRNHVPPWEPIELRRGEHGELLPLDAPDRDMVDRARSAADPKIARESECLAREAAEDDAVLRIVADRPGIAGRDLERALRAALRCGEGRASVAIARMLPRLVTRPGPRRARLHYSPGATVPGDASEGA
jgi:hypothetical protein